MPKSGNHATQITSLGLFVVGVGIRLIKGLVRVTQAACNRPHAGLCVSPFLRFRLNEGLGLGSSGTLRYPRYTAFLGDQTNLGLSPR